MKVRELVEQLRTEDQDAEIWVVGSDVRGDLYGLSSRPGEVWLMVEEES